VPLPSPSARKASHTRTVVYRGYDREDGLWDIEAELTDVKAYAFKLLNERPFEAGEPVHGLSIRLTIDSEFLIHDVATSMDHIPHATCEQAPASMHQLKGCRIGKGWRKQIDEKVGGIDGCTHLREMLFNMATAAYQTLGSGKWRRMELKGQPHPPQTEMPSYLDQCHTWARGSVNTQHFFPMFHQPPRDPSNAESSGQQQT
jgi:hypothetical protein